MSDAHAACVCVAPRGQRVLAARPEQHRLIFLQGRASSEAASEHPCLLPRLTAARGKAALTGPAAQPRAPKQGAGTWAARAR